MRNSAVANKPKNRKLIAAKTTFGLRKIRAQVKPIAQPKRTHDPGKSKM
jgi:hypothetical protein